MRYYFAESAEQQQLAKFHVLPARVYKINTLFSVY